MGITLRHVICTYPTMQQIWTDSTTKRVISANIEHGDRLSLERTIHSMCAPNIRCRASLMYLLDVSFNDLVDYLPVFLFKNHSFIRLS